MNPEALELQQVTLRIGNRVLVDSLSLTVDPGEVVTLMGESGAGKSTLLAFICGALPSAFAATGRVWIGGKEITQLPPESRRLGILFQDDLLFPHLSVAQNLAFALPAAVRNRVERRQRIESVLNAIGLGGFGERDPASLSGGQRARVSLIRVLLAEPRGLLLDEPFSKLDRPTRSRFREWVFDQVRERNLPTLLVTHEPEDALAAAGRVLQIANGTSTNG